MPAALRRTGERTRGRTRRKQKLVVGERRPVRKRDDPGCGVEIPGLQAGEQPDAVFYIFSAAAMNFGSLASAEPAFESGGRS